MRPPPQEEGPDDQGIKTITTFRRNDKNQVEKVRKRDGEREGGETKATSFLAGMAGSFV